MSKLNEEIIARFLMGECSESELHEVNAWLEESKDNSRQLFRLEEIYHLGKLNDTQEEQHTYKAEKQLLRRLKQETFKQHKQYRITHWVRYAAVLLSIFVLSGVGYLSYQNYSQSHALLTVATLNEIKELKLPDGTKVWLNKNTTLKYPREFSADGRNIYLEGEGYFEVKHNPRKPFVIQSEAMQVRVLGTVFNFKTEKKQMSAIATLVEGEIQVKGNHEEGMIILSPGQKAELNGMTRKLVVKPVDAGFENWHDNQFVFDKADVYTIARILESSYGVKIILAPGIDVKKTYSGTIQKKGNVKDVLQLIQNAVPIDYKVVGSSVFLSTQK